MVPSDIKSVLIANRGEIAVRIVRTLRSLGIESVAVHHGPERDALFVREADRSVEIAGDTPVSAYLDAPQIVRAAREAGADAIHPGYGFLAENAEFARLTAEAGLTFIGPAPETIALMGDKLAARDFVLEHGYPVAPSLAEGEAGEDFAALAASEVGLPLVIKAAAGGGGKGMYVVRDAADLPARIDTARREATRYFGDGRLYAERYVERPRHIEVQILADAHGHCLHLGDRECSIQRRYQKIIEEAPAPALDPTLRDAVLEAAVGIARAAGYLNAGTVEFVLSPDGDFYFLEMNTRLQVEHPVTEMVTGLDLVAEQIAIASGRPLSFGQSDVAVRGHAIECRVYAEDPDDGFAPATGTVIDLVPPQGPGLRFDSGLVVGQAVAAAFDPMLAKLVAHGSDRAMAIARMRGALADTVLLGVTTNLGFLDRVLAHAGFAAGGYDTGALDRWADAVADPGPDTDLAQAILAVAVLGGGVLAGDHRPMPHPHAAMGPWRN
ncbi:MAG: biotin carboxylase N-terminal domain-containing protein [Bauldia litoralis]